MFTFQNRALQCFDLIVDAPPVGSAAEPRNAVVGEVTSRAPPRLSRARTVVGVRRFAPRFPFGALFKRRAPHARRVQSACATARTAPTRFWIAVRIILTFQRHERPRRSSLCRRKDHQAETEEGSSLFLYQIQSINHFILQ